jgi:hypothetical protein
VSTTTARSKEVLEKTGFRSGLVERHLPHTFTTVDWLGFADILAFQNGITRVWAINATTNSNLSAHIKKYDGPWEEAIQEHQKVKENIEAWVNTGHVFEIWCWAKRGDRGKRKLWTLKRVRRQINGEWNEIAEPLKFL